VTLPIYFNVGNTIGLIPNASAWAKRTGSVSIRAETPYRSAKDIDRAKAICYAHDARIALVAGPFQNWLRPGVPNDVPNSYRGVGYSEQFDKYAKAYEQIAKWIECDSDLVGAILFDCERFTVSKDAAENLAMAETLDRIHDQAKGFFPKARIEFYCRGVYWDQPSIYWSGLEKKIPSLSMSVACPNHPAMMERWFNATVKISGGEDITPWVHIGNGYDNGDASHFGRMLVNPSNARWMGAFLRSSEQVKCLVIHPGPEDTPEWNDHFDNFMQGFGQ
jgi:hypothetical protein